MVNFVMMVGLPASGKSSYAKNNYKDYIIHSSDKIREELYGNESEQGNPEEVFNLLHERVLKDLKDGKNVVYDATNINYKQRKEFLKRIPMIVIKTCCFMYTPLDVCLQRNRERERQVPEYVIERMYKKFDVPYYNEGWDDIELIRPTREVYDSTWGDIELADIRYDMNTLLFSPYGLINFDQRNKHHTLTLGEHMRRVGDYLKEKNEDDFVLYEAGYLHDLGKVYTQRFTDSQNRPTVDAHYYNHEQVGAYESIDMYGGTTYSKSAYLYRAFLIRWHMMPYNFTHESTVSKYKRIWGEREFNDIMKLHEADKLAH